jgi:O-antigen/teichoic acid export membrane protein
VRPLNFLLSNAAVLMLARFAGAGAGFFSQILLARLLPSNGLGIFFAATSLAAVVGLLVAQGYPEIVQRFVTRYRENRRPDLLTNFIAQAQRETWMISAAVTISLVAFAFLSPTTDGGNRFVIVATAFTAAACSFSIYPALACADRRFSLGLLPEILVRPVLFLAFIAAMGFSGLALTAGLAIAVYGAISAFFSLVLFFSLRTQPMSPVRRPSRRLRRKWREEGRPLMIVALFRSLFQDVVILMTSPFLGIEALGPFGVALKLTMLVGFTIQIAHQMALPDLAEAFHRKDPEKMTHALSASTVLPAVITLVTLALVFFWGDHVLALFGPDYRTAKWGLVILVAAQLLRAIAGPAPMLLTLNGAQKTNAAINVACCGVLLVANAVLIPHLGLTGACLSVLLVVVTWTSASAVSLWRLTNLRADLLSLRSDASTGGRLVRSAARSGT